VAKGVWERAASPNRRAAKNMICIFFILYYNLKFGTPEMFKLTSLKRYEVSQCPINRELVVCADGDYQISKNQTFLTEIKSVF
jgi:hypothetical protein